MKEILSQTEHDHRQDKLVFFKFSPDNLEIFFVMKIINEMSGKIVGLHCTFLEPAPSHHLPSHLTSHQNQETFQGFVHEPQELSWHW